MRHVFISLLLVVTALYGTFAHAAGLTAEVVELINTLGTPLLKTRVFDRVSLARSSMTSGILKSADQKAIEEVTLLAEEIVDLISV